MTKKNIVSIDMHLAFKLSAKINQSLFNCSFSSCCRVKADIHGFTHKEMTNVHLSHNKQ